MRQFGLLGYPLSHSFSKGYFTEKFQRENIDAEYELFSIPDIRQFPELLAALPNFAGMNVTIPYKQAVIPYLDDLDAEAREMGAVNVIKPILEQDGSIKLIGYNSDLYGFRASILPFIETLKTRLPEHTALNALVLGTGGASKAVLFGLKQLGIQTQLVSRSATANQLSYDQLQPARYETHHIIVNTTPLGMSPSIETYPPLHYNHLNETHLLYDLVYNPDETRFLQFGKQQGCLTKNGLEMLHLQAEEAWRIWNL